MNRLQKKCLVAAASTHLLLVVVLLCSGFIKPKPKVDDSQVLEMIPDKVIAQAFTSGVKNAQLPPPAPLAKPPEPQPQPQPAPPKPVVKVVEPPPKPVEKIQPDDLKPADRPEPKPPKVHEVKPDLIPVVRKNPTPPDNSAAEAAKAEKEAQKQAQRERATRINALRQAANTIRNSTSASMEIKMPGTSSVAYANYSSIVRTVYTLAWQAPDSVNNDEANVQVSVTIARDGRVISARIIEKSGDTSVDRSVQNTLDRVVDMDRPFEDGATENERTYIINFNLKAKRMLG